MKPDFQIGSREIGDEYPPFVIAEVGINHDGEYEKAIDLVDVAVESGADCVKFQCHITEAELVPTDMKPGEISQERLWDIIKRCELTEDEERRVKAYCEKRGILYLCTPFSREAADRLERMEVLGYKIGSGECNNLPLLEHIARKGKPVILSTGMNDIPSIRRSVELIRKYDVPLMLMHCTSMYPTPYENVCLGAIETLKREFGLPVGLSDHSIGPYTCLGAVALGACALEKHFTMTRNWPGPDVPLSIEPSELAELVKGAHAIYAASAKDAKKIQSGEQPVIDFAYASVVTIRSLEEGEPFTLDNLWVKRPGTGIPAAELGRILGRTARRFLETDIQLKLEDIVE